MTEQYEAPDRPDLSRFLTMRNIAFLTVFAVVLLLAALFLRSQNSGESDAVAVITPQNVNDSEPRVTDASESTTTDASISDEPEPGGADAEIDDQGAGSTTPQDIASDPTSEGGSISSWPAGPLAGAGPGIASGEVDGDGCIALATGESLETSHTGATTAVWIYADPGDQLRVDWESISEMTSFAIPQAHLESRVQPGRVTVTLSGTTDPARVTFAALSAPTRVCGLQNRIGGLISSWPAGPIGGIRPIAPTGVGVDADGCAIVGDGDDVELRVTGAASVYISTAIDATVTLTWSDSTGTDSMTIPAAHLEHEFTPGRVTVTLAQPDTEATVTVVGVGADVTICGLISE